MDTNPVAQLHIARANPLPTAIGAMSGIVPIGIFEIGHYELVSWNPALDAQALLVYAGLVFSALTVTTWGADMFTPASAGRWGKALAFVKALAFTAIVEGMMMTSANVWLTGAALVLLVAINATANGCRLAVRAASAKATESERAALRSAKRRAKPAAPTSVALAVVR